MTLRTTPGLTTFLMNLSELSINEALVISEIKKQEIAQPHVIAEQLEMSRNHVNSILAKLMQLNKVRAINHGTHGLVYELA